MIHGLVLSFALLLFWPSHGLATPAQIQPGQPPESTKCPGPKEPRPPPYVVFHADKRSPNEIRGAGGFRPPTQFPPPRGYSLLNYLDDCFDLDTGCNSTVYVSTSRTFGAAARLAGHGNWVYFVHGTPNMVDVAHSLECYDVRYEHDFAAAGGIRWEQIMGWIRVPHGYPIPAASKEDICIGDIFQFNLNVQRNDGYRRDRYSSLTASGGRPELAGYRPNDDVWSLEPWRSIPVSTREDLELLARKFMSSIGARDRWLPNCPIFKRQLATGTGGPSRKLNPPFPGLADKVQPKIVYRGDKKDPRTIKNAGGFLPRSVLVPKMKEAYGIYNHVREMNTGHDAPKKRETIYVSTTASFGIAGWYAVGRKTGGWLYHIQATPNMIDVNGSLLSHTPFPDEEEYVAMTGILWPQVRGYIHIPENYSGVYWGQPEYDNIGAFSERYIENSDYDPKFDGYTASPGQPQLAGFVDEAEAYNYEEPWASYLYQPTKEYAMSFMEANGGAVNWRGYLPLFDPPKS